MIHAALMNTVAREYFGEWTLDDATEALHEAKRRVEARTHGSAMFNAAFPCAHEVFDEDEAGRTCMTCRRPLPEAQP